MKIFQIKNIRQLLKTSRISWNDYKLGQHGAALSFITILSLPSLLFLVLVQSRLFFTSMDVTNYLVTQINEVTGKIVSDFVKDIIINTFKSDSYLKTTIFNVVLLFFVASAVFIQLRDSLNAIFGVEHKKINVEKSNKGIMAAILLFAISFMEHRIRPFLIILVISILLPMLVFVSLVLTAMTVYLSDHFEYLRGIVNYFDSVILFMILLVVFTLMFKFVPSVILKWKDVMVGAFITSFLFLVGKFFIGLYLSKSEVVSLFGASSSLFLLMVWFFYSSQIVFVGAIFTRSYAERSGVKVSPTEDAGKVVSYFKKKTP